MKKIVIIGGGFTGTKCAKKLQRKYSVTLIDTKPYFEYTPSILRTILEPDHQYKIQKLHKDYLIKTKIVEDEVINLHSDHVVTKKGDKIFFDYLIIASGSSYAVPIKEEGLVPATRAKELVKYHKELEKAQDVLIIGGGLVGVELTAEIATHYKNKNITLIHSHSELIGRNHEKSRKYAEKFLRKHNVKLIFNEKVQKTEGPSGKKKKFKTNTGRKIHTDFAFITVGIVPNYEFMKKEFSKILSERNQINVNEYLQVPDSKNIFVGGDITALREEKTAQTAEEHADLIVQNIKRLEQGKDMIKYENKKRPMVISLGKYDGIFEQGNFVITGFIPALLKWFVERKTMRKH